MTQARQRVSAVADRLREHWTGKRVVLLVNRYEGAIRALVDELVSCGATVAAVVAGDRMPADGPVVDHVWNCADHGGALRRKDFDTWLRTPPEEVERWLDELDPRHEWTVLGTSYTDVGEYCGRPVHGWWRPEWAAWEDKTRVDDLWRGAGMQSPPHVVLAPGDPEFVSWAERLDRGRGVMVAVDNTHGILGSSKGLRWVRDSAELAAAREAFAAAGQVRIASYLPGTPCSIMAMVLPDGVAVFEPFEIITLRRPDTAELVYGGTSTYWRATPAARAEIREKTRAVGRYLAETVGFRGMFSVDGMADETGFAATELNPRHVSGLTLWAGWPGFPVRLFNRAVQEGDPGFTGLDPRDVEEAFCAAIQGSPAHMIKLPAPSARHEETGTDVFTVSVGERTLTQEVRYRTEVGSVRLLAAEPVLDDGSAAPATAALAAAFGNLGLVPFHDDSAGSDLATGR